MWRVVTDMTSTDAAQARTALSPEWDRGFDEAFTELVTSDPDLVRDEFDALVGASWNDDGPSRTGHGGSGNETRDEPPGPPSPPAPPTGRPDPPRSPTGHGAGPPAGTTDRVAADPSTNQRSPP
jgi:hypothetical protein